MADYLNGREVVLIAPAAARGKPFLRRPGDVARHRLLQHISVPNAWSHWLEAHGVKGVNAFAGPQLDQFHGLIRAVSAGMGLALVPRCLVRDDIASGLVSMPFDEDYADDLGYWLCYPEAQDAPAVA